MPGQRPSSGSSSPGTSHAMLSAPTASGRRSAHQREPLASIPPAGEERVRVARQLPRARAHEDHVAGDGEPLGGALEVLGADRVARLGAVEQDPAREQRLVDRARAELRLAVGRLHLGIDPHNRLLYISKVSAWWQNEVSMCVPECSAITNSAEALVRGAQPRLVAACSFEQHAAGAGHTGDRAAAARGRRSGRRPARSETRHEHM